MPRRRPHVGDIVRIPLTHGRWGYCQFVHADPKFGPLIQVFDLITDAPISAPEEVASAQPLFPPVITGLFAAVSRGGWTVIGQLPVKDFKYHGFVSTFYDQNSGRAAIWFLWDGSDSIRLGDRIPPQHRGKEYLVVWDPSDVAARIETGEYPFPYGDLLKYGYFVPRRAPPNAK